VLAVNRRGGFTVVELLVAIALLMIVFAAIHDGLRRQQQVFRSIASMIAARGDARDAAEVLAADLAAASPLDTLALAVDSAVEYLSSIASSVSCDSAPAYTLRLPPEKLTSGIVLTSILAMPDSGDLLLVHNDDTAAVSDGPRWDRHAIASVSTQPASATCPAATNFTAPADALAPAYVVNLRTPASPAIRKGAPVRILRRTRFSLYRSSDSRWYLGQRRCDPLGPSSCRPIQPVSGPYAGYSSAGRSGVSLEYFDPGGTALAPSDAGARVARIGVAVRGRPQLLPRFGRSPAGDYADSSAIAVALRNRD